MVSTPLTQSEVLDLTPSTTILLSFPKSFMLSGVFPRVVCISPGTITSWRCSRGCSHVHSQGSEAQRARTPTQAHADGK